jgi:dUTP pyrophosphatase
MIFLTYVNLHNDSKNRLEHIKSGDVGLDLRAYLEIDEIVLPPLCRVTVNTGVAIQFLDGLSDEPSVSHNYYAMVCPRSGLAEKYGVTVLNSPGIIDSGYTGEVKVILFNSSKKSFVIKHLDRIAQLVVVEKPKYAIVPVDYLKPTDRNDSGLGSTGIM